MIYYTESHEWIALSGNIGTVGITSYAQKELGDIVHIELPKQGTLLKAGEEAAVLESTKSAADIYSPVSGKVIAVNDALRTDPKRINKDAESKGWLFQIEVLAPEELKKLLSHEAYTAHVGS